MMDPDASPDVDTPAPEEVATPCVISLDTAGFLLELLDTVTLSASAPNFEMLATAVIKARRELTGPQPEEEEG